MSILGNSEEVGASKNEEARASNNEYRCHYQRVEILKEHIREMLLLLLSYSYYSSPTPTTPLLLLLLLSYSYSCPNQYSLLLNTTRSY